MSRNIQAELEAEADKKGLSGDRRKRYIGGAWNEIKHGKERRRGFRESDEYRQLSRTFGTVHDVKHPRARVGMVAFRQGRTWYELPRSEYKQLIKTAREEEREERRAQEEYERGKRVYERELARIEREDERERKREAKERELASKRKAQEEQAQERMVRKMEREESADVRAIIKRAGGIRRSKSLSGKEYEREEYNRNIPKDLRMKQSTQRGHAFKQGLSADEAATSINEHMPWLNIHTPDDLYNYFERLEDRRNNKRTA